MVTESANTALNARAQRVLVGGVNSPVRAFNAVGTTPRVITHARGSTLTDADGRDYIDYIGSWGPMILGHANPLVREAIERAARDGTAFGLNNPHEIELAEEIVGRLDTAERVRFTNSGTEAVMTAARLARATTGRQIIVKFDGCYHGHADPLLAKIGSAGATLALPDSPGIPREATANTIVVPFNDVQAFDEAVRAHADDIAAVIIEPVAGNMGVVLPEPGFLEHLRAWTWQHGALLVFDEVMTGFRVGPAGAQGHFGIDPDLTALGKIIGGGLPVGAVTGPARIMDQLAPAGPVYQAGTFAGNPATAAAGVATLRQLDEATYARLDGRTGTLADELTRALAGTAVVQSVGSMLTVFFTDQPVTRFDDARGADHDAYARFFRAMLERGIHLPPSGYEAWFLSTAHSAEQINRTVQAARESIPTLGRAARRHHAHKQPCMASIDVREQHHWDRFKS